MKKNSGLIDADIKEILLSDDYSNTLKKIGFSDEFILNEKIRKQRECIEYLVEKISELKKIIISVNKKNSDLSSLIKSIEHNLN
jgi:hypothetical protein